MNEQILEIVRRDLAGFADPGTELTLSHRGASWQQQRKSMNVVFSRGEETFPRIELANQQFSYRSFFASEHMADLPALAEAIHHSMPEPRNYVDAPALQEGADEPETAADLLARLSTSSLPFGATRVLFVRGSAGAGKTVALKHLTVSQAEKVALGASSILFFYIDAQARALARLDEAVALLLQDLRASFTYKALATLTRLELVVPIIDGFDELLGAGGYGEAFDSLAKFLARLDGRGSLVASARSTFYEYKDFRASATRYEKGRSLNFEIVPVDVLPWRESEVASYLEEAEVLPALGVSTSDEGVKALKERLSTDGQQFLRTPFFVATLVELVKQGTFVSPDERIIPQIILHFIAREREKLRDKQDQPIMSESGHRLFLERLAEEMWWQGARELDVDTVKVIAELLAEELDLMQANRVTLVERSPSYAFFERREHEGRRFLGFTHEYYYSFFLGQFIARAVDSADGLPQLLTRARMTPLFGDEFAHALMERAYRPEVVVENLASRQIPSLTRDLNRTNAGVLFAGLIRVAPSAVNGLRISSAEFLQEDLDSTEIHEVEVVDCEFVRCSFSRAHWQDVVFRGSRLIEPIVARHTTDFGGIELEIGESLIGLVVRTGEREAVVYDPAEVAEVSQEIGISTPLELPQPPDLSSAGSGTIEVLRRFLRSASRLFYISDDDLKTRGISSNQYWSDLESMLREHGLMEFVVIQRQGPRNEVRRLTVPPAEIERGESGNASTPEIARFWKAIRAL